MFLQSILKPLKSLKKRETERERQTGNDRGREKEEDSV